MEEAKRGNFFHKSESRLRHSTILFEAWKLAQVPFSTICDINHIIVIEKPLSDNN